MWIVKMIKKITNNSFNEKAYEVNRNNISESNIKFYKIFNWIMVLLLTMLYTSTFFIDYAKSMSNVYIIFLALSIIEIILLKMGITSSPKISTYTIYYVIIKTYIFCILSSVTYNTNAYAISFFIFMILIPISFILDQKVIWIVQTVAAVLFCASTIELKPANYAIGDVIACLLFYVISFVISGHINGLRINNLYVIGQEHKKNADLENQKEILGITLGVAKLCNVLEDDFRKNIPDIINTVQQQYKSDRVYIFEFDWENDLMSNTYESVAANVTKEIENLQNLPISTTGVWIDLFRDEKEVVIDNLEKIKDDPNRQDEYNVLKPQGIESLIVIPISRNHHLYGYIGVDNPSVKKNEYEFIMNVAQLLSQEFYICEQQKNLARLSYCDFLTGLKNRHSYEVMIEQLGTLMNDDTGLGVVFADVNGLKYVNDTYGHLEGDAYIRKASELLSTSFNAADIFRISGDEFVVIVQDQEQSVFDKNVKKMIYDNEEKYDSILAIGSIWDKTKQILELVSEAEAKMYMDKRGYYEKYPEKSRQMINNI